MPFRLLAVLATFAVLLLPLAPAQESNWTPSGMDALSAHATLHTDFTFDKTMLNAMSQNLPDEERKIVGQLRSITVHNFRYSATERYDPAVLEALRAQYGEHGWNHLVTKQGHTTPAAPAADPAGSAAPGPAAAGPRTPAVVADPTRTDLWARMAHGNVDGIVVLVANQRNVTLVTVDGTISPLDLLHLRGHFGIPRFSGDDIEDAH